jgi:hypothetical protein
MGKSSCFVLPFASLLLFAFGSPAAPAQMRMSDKDVENGSKNMLSDAKKFRSSFDSAVGKSAIRKTSQEKDAKNLVEQFQKQTEQTLKQFQKDKTAGTGLAALRSNADQIDRVLATTAMGPNVTDQWSKVRTELGLLSSAFGM